MRSGDVLGQRTEVGVGTRFDVTRPLGNPPCDIVGVPGPPQIIDEVSHRCPERSATRNPVCCSGQGHRMPGLRRQKIVQLRTIAILELREDPL